MPRIQFYPWTTPAEGGRPVPQGYGRSMIERRPNLSQPAQQVGALYCDALLDLYKRTAMTGGDHRWPDIAQALKRGQLVAEWVDSEVRANSNSHVPMGEKMVPGQKQRVGGSQ